MNLPNDCTATALKVSPSNWNRSDAPIKKDWIIHYTFTDPKRGKKRVQIKGMNRIKDLPGRRAETKKLIEVECHVLNEGLNPFDRAIVPQESDMEVTPYTPFIAALWIAVGKIRCSHNHKLVLESNLRGFEKSAIQLNLHNRPLKEISRKHFNLIFEQCYKNNPNFTGNTQNRYKRNLGRMYRELFKMEAVDSNPLLLIERARVIKKQRVLPTKEHREVINSLKETHYYLWRMIQLFFSSGARETEFARLRVEEVDLKTQYITLSLIHI